MKNYSIEEREAFGNKYLSLEVSDLSLLGPLQQIISSLECVHRVNISEGKRQHLTIYIQKFVEFSDAEKEIKQLLDSIDVNNITPISTAPSLPQDNTAQEGNPDFAIVKSPLDTLPNNCPIVFISYAWDNAEHKQWVLNFSNDLRSKYNVYTILDQYNRGGINLVEFMRRGIKVSHRVIVVGSPKYKEKLDSYNTPCGTLFEDQIMTIEMYNGVSGKFIPVLRKGSFSSSFSDLMGVQTGYDFSNDSTYEEELKRLSSDLWGKGPTIVPELSSKAAFIAPATVANSSPDPYRGERTFARLLESFSFNIMDDYLSRMPERCNMAAITSFDMWSAILSTTAYKIKDKVLEKLITDFYSAWAEIVKFGEVHYSPSSNGMDYYFYHYKFDVFDTPNDEKAFYHIAGLIPNLASKYKLLADYIKENYPDVDLEDTSSSFEKAYCK